VKALLAAALASAALVGGYLALDGGSHEPTPAPDPCGRQSSSAGGAVTGTLERIGLNGLASAACDLGVSRERLLLSLAGEVELPVDDERRTEAFRDGLRRAIDDEERAGRLSASQAFLLRQGLAVLPVDALLEQLFQRRGG
jgi:hypothetical protein